MANTNPNILSFTAVNGKTLRADFQGGEILSDFGALLISGVNRQTGLIARLSKTIKDARHPAYTQHGVKDLLAQRIFKKAH